MALPHKLQLVKKEIEDLIQRSEKLWNDYSEDKLDGFIENAESNETFELGWDLGKVDAWQDILNFIEDMEN
jgi:hypothetical protein